MDAVSREQKLETALKELEGFARRNEERAKKAAASIEADQWARVKDPKGHHGRIIEAYARLHEAVRVYQVVKLRVEEALHEK